MAGGAVRLGSVNERLQDLVGRWLGDVNEATVAGVASDVDDLVGFGIAREGQRDHVVGDVVAGVVGREVFQCGSLDGADEDVGHF